MTQDCTRKGAGLLVRHAVFSTRFMTSGSRSLTVWCGKSWSCQEPIDY